MTTCLGKSCSFDLLCVSFVNVYECLYVYFFPCLVLRVGWGFLCGRYKVRKEPLPVKRCEKRYVLWKKNSLCYIMHIELNLDNINVIKNKCQ